MSLKHIFWPITDCSIFYAAGVKRVRSLLLRRIGGRGHFRSRDKGGHTIRTAISEKPMLYANFTTLSFTEPELLPTEVLHCGNREFRVFLRKIMEIIKNISSHPKNNVAVAETHFMTHYRLIYLVCYRSYTRSKSCFTPNRWAWSLPVTWQRWRSHHSIGNCRKPPAIRKLRDSIFYRTRVIADWSFTLRE